MKTLWLSLVIVALAMIILSGGAPVRADVSCRSWEVVATPNPGSGNTGLVDVGAHSALDARAVGSSGAGPFTLLWDGDAWNEEALPDLTGLGLGFAIDAVSAIPDDGYWIVGIIQVHVWNAQPLALRHDGSDWDFAQAVELQRQDVWPFAERNGHALAVDALDASDAWAVGVADGFGGGVGGSPPLTMHWNGSEWSEVLAPAVGTRQNNLYGVAMVASDDVWAVGEYSVTGTGFRALLLRWDGSEWAPWPNPAEQISSSGLNDIAVIAPDDIWAVGGQPNDAILMHWDGSSWTITDSPVDGGMWIGQVDAAGSDDVWATGADAYGEDFYFHYDGIEWTVIVPPVVPGAQGVAIGGGLAVTGPCDAWAVGSWFDGSWVRTLAERLRPRRAFDRSPVRFP